MSDGNSLINLGELSKPATVLIEKVSNAVGVIYEPRRIIRRAEAEAEAEKIKAFAEIEVSDIERRGLVRMIHEEGKLQENMERITAHAAKQIGEDAKPEDMDDEWIADFFDKCRNVSNEEMQTLWGNILAGEANNQGTFSKKTLQIVSTLDKRDADLFTRFASFTVTDNSEKHLAILFDVSSIIAQRSGLDFVGINHLEALGLVKLDFLGGFRTENRDRKFGYRYFDKYIQFTIPMIRTDPRMEIGIVMLTISGQELIKICGARYNPEFVSYLVTEYAKKDIRVDFAEIAELES